MQMSVIEATLEGSADACVIVSSTGKIGSWNAAASQFFGRTKAEMLGQPFVSCVAHAKKNTVMEALAVAVQSNTATLVETPCVASNGRGFEASVSITPMRNGAAQVEGALLIIRDITAHQKALGLLKDREFKLQAIVGCSPSALSLKTPDGQYALANPNLQAIHQCNEAALIGKTDFDLYPAAFAETFRCNDHVVLTTKCRHSIEEQVPVHGEIRSFMSHMFPIFDEAQQIQYICHISLDITDKKKAEAEVYKLVQAIEQSPIGVLITDEHNNIEFVNKSFLDTTAYTLDEVLGKTPALMSSGKTPASVYKSLSETLAKGEVWTGEFINRRKDGTEYYDAAVISPIRQSDGKITHYLATQQNVTEHKLIQRKLQESEERFNLAMQGSSDGLWDWDIEKHLVYLSPSWKKMLGYADQELPSSFETWENLLHPDDRQIATDNVYRAIADKNKTQFTNQFRLAHKNGHWLRVLSRGLIIRDELGQAKRLVGTNLDHTEIEALQSELEEAWMTAQAEARSNDTKSKFLAAVNREIRTPLDSARGFTRLIRDESTHDDNIHRHADMLEHTIESLIMNLNDLDDFAKIDAGTLQINRGAVNLENLTSQLAETANLECLGSGLTLQTNFTSDCSPWVMTDATRVSQIVNNLLSNALKFTKTGEIHIKTSLYNNPSDATDSSRIATIEVSDTGVGMSSDKLKKMFEPFVQLHSDAGNRHRGSGLGLTIVKSLVDLMNGEIRSTSTLGQGTQIFVQLPMQSAETEATPSINSCNPVQGDPVS